MNTSRKHGLAFCGTILSVTHFAAALFFKNLPLFMLRFEDMVGSGETKPYWLPSRLRQAVEGTGDVLSLPARWLYESFSRMPDVAALLLFILSSCLWGFSLALLLRLLLSWLRASHEPHPA